MSYTHTLCAVRVELGEALSWGFQLVIDELVQGRGGELHHSGSTFYDRFLGRYMKKVLGKHKPTFDNLIDRPLFGVIPGVLPPTWGGLSAAELAAIDRALPDVEAAPDDKDGDVEQWYFDLREAVTSLHATNLDVVTFYS